MTHQEQKAKLEELIAEFAKDSDIQKLVTQIEAKPETTQHHYGDYGAAIAHISKGSKTAAYVIKEAMKRCGGNSQGIDNGFSLFV